MIDHASPTFQGTFLLCRILKVKWLKLVLTFLLRVIAYFKEGNETLSTTIQTVVEKLPLFTRHRVIIYAKNGIRSEEAVSELMAFADEVVWLPNLGREGETFLVSSNDYPSDIGLCREEADAGQTHITRHYQSASTDLAKYTIFMQVSIPSFSIESETPWKVGPVETDVISPT